MHYHFKEAKALQATARFLSLSHGRRKYIDLMKLLYLADRAAIMEWGFPITGDECYSMKRGPILSRTLNLLKGTAKSDAWHRCIPPARDYTSELKLDPGIDELSQKELKVIDAVFVKFGGMNTEQLVEYCHQQLREYKDPTKIGLKRIEIDLEEIHRQAGRSAAEIKEIDECEREERYLDFLLSERQ